MNRLAAALCVIALLAGCTAGPDYHLPAGAAFNLPAAQGAFLTPTSPSPSAASPSAASPSAASPAARPAARPAAPPAVAMPVPPRWWHLFDDPRLDALQAQALAANTSLRAASANLARADAILAETRGTQEVHASAAFAADRTQLSAESFLLSAPLPATWLGDGGVHVSYQLDLFGRLKRAAEAAADDRQAAQAGLELARITVAAEVARAYVDSCAAGGELAAATRQADLLARMAEITSQFAAAGRLAPVAVAQADAQAEQARAALPPLRAAGRAALYRLATLTGKPPAAYPREIEGCARVPLITQTLPVGGGAGLLRRRPDIAQAERGLAAATARIGVATASLYPDITLGANAGAIGTLADLGLPATQTWALGSLIAWTFPTRGERARVDEASAAAAGALAQFDQTVLTALQETETSLTVYAQDLQRNQALRHARDAAAEAAQQTQALVEAGRSPPLTGLSVQQALAAAEVALAASDAQVARDQVALFLALGGGWSPS